MPREEQKCKHDYRSDGRSYCYCIKCGKDKYCKLKKENEGYKKLIKSCPQAQVCPYVKVISFTPDSELAKKVIDEQREELEACRDANVQKKKRISELEDALKRAEGVSVEEIESCLWKQFPDLQTLTKPIAQAIHALLTTRKRE